MNSRKFRNNGAIGALFDEYERALDELDQLLASVSDETISIIVDNETENPECRSIQTILTHLIKAGQWYNIEIRNALGENLKRPEPVIYDSVNEYREGLKAMFASSEKTFTAYPNADLYIVRNFRWKNIPSIDMLLEHAIVHILRHRRQIEKFLQKIEGE